MALAPAPGLAQLADLVDDFRNRGLDVDARLPEPLPALPAALDLSAYRIVQEALTNALKHGADRTAALVLSSDPQALRIDASNPTDGEQRRREPARAAGDARTGRAASAARSTTASTRAGASW